MTFLNDTEMREILGQLIAKTNDGTVRWRAVNLFRLQTQYEDNMMEISVSYGYRRRPPGKWPVWYRLAVGRSIPSVGSVDEFGPDKGVLYSYHADAFEKGIASLEGRTWSAMENLYRTACKQDGRAENLRSWSRVEWGCFRGCLMVSAGLATMVVVASVAISQFW